MAIDIFKIMKADRYTQDGRDEINKALNETEDAGLPDGTMRHRKNGDFIKQGGEWVPAKNAKAGAGKVNRPNSNGVVAQQKQKMEAETKPYKTSDIERVDKNNLKLGEVTATKEADGVWSVKNAKGEEVARALSVDIARESMVKSANRKPGESKYPNVSKEEKIKKLAEYFRLKYGKTTEEWSKTLEKSPEETLEDRYEEYAKKHLTDSAPRVLTGDTKIHVRKSK